MQAQVGFDVCHIMTSVSDAVTDYERPSGGQGLVEHAEKRCTYHTSRKRQPDGLTAKACKALAEAGDFDAIAARWGETAARVAGASAAGHAAAAHALDAPYVDAGARAAAGAAMVLMPTGRGGLALMHAPTGKTLWQRKQGQLPAVLRPWPCPW